jgi:hypothetical protein
LIYNNIGVDEGIGIYQQLAEEGHPDGTVGANVAHVVLGLINFVPMLGSSVEEGEEEEEEVPPVVDLATRHSSLVCNLRRR